MFKLDPCFSGGSFKGGAIFVGGFKVFIAFIVFLILVIAVDFEYSEIKAFEEESNTRITTRMITLITIELLDIMFAVLLIIGAVKSRTGLLMSWIVYTITYCCLVVMGFIIVISTMPVSSKTVAGLLITEAIHVYFLLIVNSLRLEMEEKKNQHIMVYKTMPPEPEKC